MRSASSPLAAVSHGRPICASTAAMTFRTETSSSTISTRRVTECSKGIGSVANCHPASAALCTPVKTGFFLFHQARSVWGEVIQLATVVNHFEIQKGVLMHEGDHPARDLVARKPSKLNRLVVVAQSLEIPCSKMVPPADSVPQWNKAKSRHSLLTWPRMDGALCANDRQHCLDTSRRSVQTAHTPSKSNWFV